MTWGLICAFCPVAAKQFSKLPTLPTWRQQHLQPRPHIPTPAVSSLLCSPELVPLSVAGRCRETSSWTLGKRRKLPVLWVILLPPGQIYGHLAFSHPEHAVTGQVCSVSFALLSRGLAGLHQGCVSAYRPPTPPITAQGMPPSSASGSSPQVAEG